MTAEIDNDTLQAYMETEYRVLGQSPFTLRIGVPSDDLLNLQAQYNTNCSAFLTAWNPFSRALSDKTNANRQQLLAGELKKRGLSFIDGVGCDPSGLWPGEDSFLVLGIDLDTARMLGDQFEQNALLWSGENGIPELVLLR